MVSRRKKSKSSEAGQSDVSNSSSSRELLCYTSIRKDPDATKEFSRSAKQLKNGSAAKQLTIYKSWMSTAERNSNGKNAQDGKNQWLRLSRANCLNSREQDLYYSGK
ncbi:hypothetical protein F511_41701 [Dorcoceras hygrometricum]|uniref:Uncharacterized protein n=1 Tax=Dorcoceras hygrometricum TaxID=472368 RepID=A0A2Z7D3K9_9LAMI|nr:hypothetical protein F511_41701 [Dorcoceras hygrometricum]